MYCHTRHYYYYQLRCQKQNKKKTKGDEHLVHAVIVTLTLARLHFDTLQKVWKVSMLGLLSAGISFSLNASKKEKIGSFPEIHMKFYLLPTQFEFYL